MLFFLQSVGAPVKATTNIIEDNQTSEECNVSVESADKEATKLGTEEDGSSDQEHAEDEGDEDAEDDEQQKPVQVQSGCQVHVLDC